MLMAYKQITKMRVTYLAVAWADKVTGIMESKLDKLQYRALRMVTGAFHNTLGAALGVLMNVPPLSISLKELADRAYLRLSTQSNWCDWRENIAIGSCARRVRALINGRGRLL